MSAFDEWVNTRAMDHIHADEYDRFVFNAGMTRAAEICRDTTYAASIADGDAECESYNDGCEKSAEAILKARDATSTPAAKEQGCSYCNSTTHTWEEHAEALRGSTSTPADAKPDAPPRD